MVLSFLAVSVLPHSHTQTQCAPCSHRNVCGGRTGKRTALNLFHPVLSQSLSPSPVLSLYLTLNIFLNKYILIFFSINTFLFVYFLPILSYGTDTRRRCSSYKKKNCWRNCNAQYASWPFRYKS